MEVFFGAAGASMVLLSFYLGMLTAEKCRGSEKGSFAAEKQMELSEREKQLLREEAEAFSALMGYNADAAYGMAESCIRRDDRFET